MCKDNSSRAHSDVPFTEKLFWFHMLSVSVNLGRPGHITRQTLLRTLRHTLQSQRPARTSRGGTPAESGASTQQSVMETEPLISAIRLLVACTNTPFY